MQKLAKHLWKILKLSILKIAKSMKYCVFIIIVAEARIRWSFNEKFRIENIRILVVYIYKKNYALTRFTTVSLKPLLFLKQKCTNLFCRKPTIENNQFSKRRCLIFYLRTCHIYLLQSLHSCLPSPLAPGPIWVQSCVCCLIWTNRNSMAVTFIFLSISLSN